MTVHLAVQKILWLNGDRVRRFDGTGISWQVSLKMDICAFLTE